MTWTGLEFVNQLTIDDDERAATLVAVSNKSVHAHICTAPGIDDASQVLCVVCR